MIKPVLDNLLLEPVDEEATPSGIVRPETSKEKPAIGKVLAVGPKCTGSHYDGKVVYKKWMGNEVKFEGKTYVIVAEKDILGLI